MLDLNDLGKYRENNRIEAKKATGGLPESLWETYSAFANAKGGVILLGVAERDEDKTLRPLTLPEPELLVEEFWARMRDGKTVSRNILTEENVRIELAEGKPIVLIEVPEAAEEEKPIYAGGECYVRCGEGDHRCSTVEWEGILRSDDNGMPHHEPAENGKDTE